ncbi:MAG: hypothetical protein WD049_00245 [Candidatus Paceibacterota bacterium]
MMMFQWTRQTGKSRTDVLRSSAKQRRARLYLELLEPRSQPSSSILGVLGTALAGSFLEAQMSNGNASLNQFPAEHDSVAASQSKVHAALGSGDGKTRGQHQPPASLAKPSEGITRSDEQVAGRNMRAEADSLTTRLIDSELAGAFGSLVDLFSDRHFTDALPALADETESSTPEDIDLAIALPVGSGGGSGVAAGAGPSTGALEGFAGAPMAAAGSTSPTTPPPAAGGPSVTMSDEVPETAVSPDGGAVPVPAMGMFTNEASISDGLLSTSCACGCGCGCGGGGGGTGCPNTAPYIVGTGCGDGCTLAEVFLDYHDTTDGDNATTVDLTQYFVDDEDGAGTLDYQVVSNSDSSMISANIVNSSDLDLEAIDSYGSSGVVVRATDSEGLYAEWTINVYSVEVLGYEVGERAWGEGGYGPPEDTGTSASGEDWMVLWKSDSHRWEPLVEPDVPVTGRVVGHSWSRPDDGFAFATWCLSYEEYGAWDRGAYGTPRSVGESAINARVTFDSIDPDVLLNRSAVADLSPNASSTDRAPRVSVHAIHLIDNIDTDVISYIDWEWEPIDSPRTEYVAELDQNLAFAELTAPTPERDYWAVHPSTAGTVTYDTVKTKVTIDPPIPLDMEANLHLAWYDPLNTVANIASTPPTANTANTVRDNEASLSPVPVERTTLEYTASESEKVAYYKVNNPRFGDNYIVAAHPHIGFETEYYFGDACGGGEELKYKDYPSTGCSSQLWNPGKPDFTAPLEQHTLAATHQSRVLNILPAVDIDIDSDNNETVERSELEETIETDLPGKVLAMNNNDDDGNGTPDHNDSGPYASVDNDLKPAKLSYDNIGTDLAGLTLKLSHGPGIKLWTTQQKDSLLPLEFILESDVIPETIYIEGTSVGQPSITWSLVQDRAEGLMVLHEDKVVTTVVDHEFQAFRPQTEGPQYDSGTAGEALYGNPFQKTEVPHEHNEDPGVGIRRNGDDDDRDGIPDFTSTDTDIRGENDLIQVDITMPPLQGVEYVLKRSNKNINVFVEPDKGGTAALHANSGNEKVVACNHASDTCTAWVEWAEMDEAQTVAVLSLEVHTDMGQVLSTEKLKFYPFTSVVIALGGEGQTPTDPSSDGMFATAIELYNDGYDVHMYDEDEVDENMFTADDGGRPYDEIVDAVNYRGVTQVAIYGYSHGGGSTKDLAQTLADPNAAALAGRDQIGEDDLVFTAYIDGVDNGPIEVGGFDPNPAVESDRPPRTQYHLNLWQENGPTRGGPLTNPAPGDWQVDVSETDPNGDYYDNSEEWDRDDDHGAIDDDDVVNMVLTRELQARVDR